MSTVLIIDDDPDFVNATEIILEREGYSVMSAPAGKEGIQLALNHKPDLVILDVMMDSVLEGVSVSRKLHQDPTTSSIPILMVTSIANTDYAELFPTDEYIHIDGFFSKPLNPDRFSKKIRRILA